MVTLLVLIATALDLIAFYLMRIHLVYAFQVSLTGDENEKSVGESIYTVKVINAGSSTGYLVKKWDISTRFSSYIEIRDQLALDFAALLQEGDEFHFGYIQRGHGVKGKQFSITDDQDVCSMYSEYQGRKEIILWMKICKLRDDGSRKRRKTVEEAGDSSLKRKKSDASSAGTNYRGHLSRMSEVEEIVEDLELRHGEKNVYSGEQLRVWGHMIQMKKHSSYDEPPDKPFFRNSKSVKGKTNTSSSGSSDGMSPAKRINLRTECINQLDKWHMLLEKGAITSDQYQQLQDTILGDIKNF